MSKQRKSTQYMNDQAKKRLSISIKEDILKAIITPRKFKKLCVNKTKNTTF